MSEFRIGRGSKLMATAGAISALVMAGCGEDNSKFNFRVACNDGETLEVLGGKNQVSDTKVNRDPRVDIGCRNQTGSVQTPLAIEGEGFSPKARADTNFRLTVDYEGVNDAPENDSEPGFSYNTLTTRRLGTQSISFSDVTAIEGVDVSRFTAR